MTARNEAVFIPLAEVRTSLTAQVDAFGRSLQANGRSKNTVSAYRRDLLFVARTLDSLRPAVVLGDVTRGLLDAALADPTILHTSTGERSPASLHRLKAAVKMFFAWAAENGLAAENPARGIRLKRLPRKPPMFLTLSE
ncbi:MAG TPA: site-specific integrase, partial [Phycisphaerae bacterium]|nr:site-specific integrase [Phycisphaerae bacterium]